MQDWLAWFRGGYLPPLNPLPHHACGNDEGEEKKPSTTAVVEEAFRVIPDLQSAIQNQLPQMSSGRTMIVSSRSGPTLTIATGTPV